MAGRGSNAADGRRATARSVSPRVVLIGLAVASLTACGERPPSVLDPRGPAAREVTSLWWPMLWTATAVTLFVIGMGVYGVVQGRRRTGEIAREVPWGDRFVLVAGLGVTAAILVAFFFVSLRSMSTLASADRPGTVRIDVTAHDWWWEIRYPNGAVTANEIHVPAGKRVRLMLRSDDVIHSLWVPQLAPKVDLIPGRVNTMWLQADRPGRYRGQCAEYCGLQHAHMAFYVVADEPATFARWMEAMAAPAREPFDALTERGRALFLSNTCAGCHTIRGTPADGRLGPDLTHLGTRETLGAGVARLTADTLARWVIDPQGIKPGITMPPTTLTQDEVRAIVAYLLSLEAAP